ncbi:microtubule binding protein Mcp1 [Schizosaccharomyces osmophilus]|uniref:Microtubule binding protein Mcp1 n=1 Tax=Schizosaccharomyces osmophilus TaxID=2545709 RepID=A0AAE9WBS4_9SCHI|nr:microtubule binding protein Mcp1 [Schizosaccharomyces osmophilus]WBW72729.1 microtubule binding protein Mcp1 [Schizosaccharomyces osmophilus]
MTDDEFLMSLEKYYNELNQLSSDLDIPFNLTIFRGLILNKISEHSLGLKKELQDIKTKCDKLSYHLCELCRSLGGTQHFQNELPSEKYYQHLLSLHGEIQKEYDSRLQLVTEIKNKVSYHLSSLGENSEGLFLDNSSFVDVSDSQIEHLRRLQEKVGKKYQSRKEMLLSKKSEILPLEKHISTKIKIDTNNLSTDYLKRINEYKGRLDYLAQKRENTSSRLSVRSDSRISVKSPSSNTNSPRLASGKKTKEPSSPSLTVKYRTEYESLLKRYLHLAKSLFIPKKDLLFNETEENQKKDDILEILNKLKQEIHNLEVETHLRGEINPMIRKYLALEARLLKESQTVKGSSTPTSKPFTLKRLKKDFQLTRANLIYSLRNWEEENERKITVFGKPLSDRLQFYSFPLQRSSSKRQNVPNCDQDSSSPQTNGSHQEMTTDAVYQNDIRSSLHINNNASSPKIGSVQRFTYPSSLEKVQRNNTPLKSPKKADSSEQIDENDLDAGSLQSQVEAQYNHFMSANNISEPASMTSPSGSLREMIQPYIPPKGSLTGSSTPENHLLMPSTKNTDINSYLGKMSSHEEDRLCKRLDSFSFSKDIISKKLRNNIHGLHFSTPTKDDTKDLTSRED